MATGKNENMKVSIIGGGGVVGSSAAYRIAHDGLASEIVLVDERTNLAEAHALDIEQAIVRTATTRVRAGGIENTKDSDIILIAVGSAGRTSLTSRAVYFKDNAGILISFVERLASLSPSALWMIATVPVDTFVHLIHDRFSISRQKIIGINGNDTSRFRWAIARALSLPVTAIDAFALGEHGDTVVPVFSHVRVNGKPVSFTSDQVNQIRTSISGFLPQWLKWKPGRTAGWTTAEFIGDVLVSIASDDNRIYACSTPLDGEYGFRQVSFGVPLRMYPGGVKEVIEFDLNPDEKEALTISVETIRRQITQGQAWFRR
jgi:malate dehydrogenase